MSDGRGTLSDVTKRFSRRGPWVLQGIDLELLPGSMTQIVGANGSGKSTLLRIGAGISRPNAGSVEVPHRVGYVPEKLAARARFSGAEYLVHMGRIKGLDRESVEARSRELLERLDLRPGPDVSMESLSKGNRQKLVIAQAFLGPVGLLVLDEPFSGLDATSHAALTELAREAQAGGTAVLLSAHHVDLERSAVRRFRLEDGRLAEVARDDGRNAARGRPMQVELVRTERAQDHDQVASMPGVASARLQDGVVLVVDTDDTQIDRVLTAAIALGWSVRSVRAQTSEGRS
jgi:ABC-2 type transport system ATP-binding protein